MPKQNYKHVAMKPEDYELLRGFAFGVELTLSAAVAALVRINMKPGENAVMTGERLLDEWRSQSPDDIPL